MSARDLAIKLIDALRKEAQKEVAQSIAETNRQCKILRQRLNSMTQQRDREKARCAELRGHIARYQAEIVKLRGR